MKGQTKKIYLGGFCEDYDDIRVDATIYSSGGILHSVYTEAVNTEGKRVYSEVKNFRHRNARALAIEYARKQPECVRCIIEDVKATLN